MTRFTKENMPWHADRPALALYDAFARDGRLPDNVRDAAQAAASDIRATVLAHGESDTFDPFNQTSYADAAGPTVHFPTRAREIDPWRPQVSESDTAFYRDVDGPALAHSLA